LQRDRPRWSGENGASRQRAELLPNFLPQTKAQITAFHLSPIVYKSLGQFARCTVFSGPFSTVPLRKKPHLFCLTLYCNQPPRNPPQTTLSRVGTHCKMVTKRFDRTWRARVWSFLQERPLSPLRMFSLTSLFCFRSLRFSSLALVRSLSLPVYSL